MDTHGGENRILIEGLEQQEAQADSCSEPSSRDIQSFFEENPECPDLQPNPLASILPSLGNRSV